MGRRIGIGATCGNCVLGACQSSLHVCGHTHVQPVTSHDPYFKHPPLPTPPPKAHVHTQDSEDAPTGTQYPTATQRTTDTHRITHTHNPMRLIITLMKSVRSHSERAGGFSDPVVKVRSFFSCGAHQQPAEQPGVSGAGFQWCLCVVLIDFTHSCSCKQPVHVSAGRWLSRAGAEHAKANRLKKACHCMRVPFPSNEG